MARDYQSTSFGFRHPRRRPGRLAELTLDKGDIAVALAGPEARHAILSEMESKDIQIAKAEAEDKLLPVEEAIKETKIERDLVVEAYQQRKAEPLRHMVEQAAAWRSVGIGERIPNLAVPGFVRGVILLLLASLDFYIFAQAYAAADGSIKDWHDPRWWLGGLLGLCVFVVGVVFTHSLKNLIAARAQQELLREADQDRLEIDPAVREKLVTLKSPLLPLLSSGLIFVILLGAGYLLRLQGTAVSDPVVTVFQSLIPLVGVAAELYLFDPFRRVLPGLGRQHRRLSKKLARLEHRLEGIQRKRDQVIEAIERFYGVEHAVLAVEQQDMGLKPTGPASASHP